MTRETYILSKSFGLHSFLEALYELAIKASRMGDKKKEEAALKKAAEVQDYYNSLA